MGIRDATGLWLEPKRWLDHLEWVCKRSFFDFVATFGVVQFGLAGGGLFLLLISFLPGRSVISTHDLQIAMFIWVPAGALWASIIWLVAYWHFNR